MVFLIQLIIFFIVAEYAFTVYTPSTLAAASIANALRGLGWGVKFGSSFSDLITMLHQLSGVEQVMIINLSIKFVLYDLNLNIILMFLGLFANVC